jgi:hypothetical protein
MARVLVMTVRPAGQSDSHMPWRLTAVMMLEECPLELASAKRRPQRSMQLCA